MPFSAFNYRPGNQLRVDPVADHTVDALDGFAASVVSGDPPTANAPNTYPLIDGSELELLVGDAEVTITFDTGDFVDITEATPTEVAAVIATASGVTAAAEGSYVRVTSDSVGVTATLQVTGGAANNALAFPTAEVVGFTGSATLVLGHAASGNVVMLADGDRIRVEQATTADESRVQLTGLARIPELASGVSWRLSWMLGGTAIRTLDFDAAGIYSLNDFGMTLAQTAGGTAIDLQVQLEPLGLAADGEAIELPGFFIDVVRTVVTSDVQLVNRVPSPAQLEIDADPLAVAFELASGILGTAVSTTDTRVYIDGVEVFDGTAFSGGWSGTVTASGTDRLFALSNAGPFESEQLLTVRVTSEHAGALGPIDETYTFTTADTTDVSVSSAQARDKLTVRVQFDDDVDSALATTPANYVFEALTVPAVSVEAQSAALVGTDAVDITVDLEWSQGADYRLTVLNVTDTTGNPLATDSAEFAGFLPETPDNRDFQLWDVVLSQEDRRADVTGELRLFMLCLQDVTDMLLCSVDRWTDILDLDVAPEAYVDAILCDLGNPFTFVELSLVDRRKLARTLVDIYKTKGTAEGLIDAVRFLVGVEITLDVVNARTDFWALGVSPLGYTTLLAPPSGDPLWYSFTVVSAVDLTDTQREQILAIADYMKAAHEHVLGVVEPSTTTPAAPAYWALEIAGASELGVTTILGL